MMKLNLFVLLVAALAAIAHAWGPGECNRDDARCCRHEAHWCWGGNFRGQEHCKQCQTVCGNVGSDTIATNRARNLISPALRTTGTKWADACERVLSINIPKIRAYDIVAKL